MTARNGSRARGTNPRATGTNPRRLGTNRSAGTAADIARVDRLKRRAVAVHRVHVGPWCEVCDDERVVDTGAGWAPCPEHRPMTANDAADVIAAHRTGKELYADIRRNARHAVT